MSYLSRYSSGEHEEVWAELRALGPVPDYLITDVDAVAAETMRRLRLHVVRIAEQLRELDFEPSFPDVSLHREPDGADREEVHRLTAEIGGLPAALAACLRAVGAIWFAGDCPAVGLSYHGDSEHGAGMPPGLGFPDPLCLPDAAFLRSEWDEYRDADDTQPSRPEFMFAFAPDELHKANISGGTHDILLPSWCADPILNNVAGRPGITLVEYLRVSIAWGGFPGWSFTPTQAPRELTRLQATPNF